MAETGVEEAAAIRETAVATDAHALAEEKLGRAAFRKMQCEAEFLSAKDGSQDADQALRRAEQAVEEAQRALQVARSRADTMGKQLQSASLRVELAGGWVKRAQENLASADARVARAKAAEEAASRDAQAARNLAANSSAKDSSVAGKSEARDLQDSIRRMQELREKEEKEQRAREAELAAKAAEKRRQEEEAERKAAEQREKEAAARREAEAAQQAYVDAALAEMTRCMRRDDGICLGNRTRWPPTHALRRFELVSIEFDAIRFSERQPVTMWNVPWPTLQHPFLLKVEDITWGMVEAFFEKARSALSTSEYQSIVEKTHRRFHPDKWRSRNLLLSVRDEELRKKLEDAGNAVAQAMTPLWRASKDLSDSKKRWW
ncbi:hypothetical protein PsYK624_087260 [Phanerochaete sordida]|uniref:Uncharacterized protein n=1 Tax=Phanerochaete sordida TaxID=48140 RepID=A0A9P3GCW1_9APHY|nr:hypothetical protein PsYK624_087260 [Phanerochaete sordida]